MSYRADSCDDLVGANVALGGATRNRGFQDWRELNAFFLSSLCFLLSACVWIQNDHPNSVSGPLNNPTSLVSGLLYRDIHGWFLIPEELVEKDRCFYADMTQATTLQFCVRWTRDLDVDNSQTWVQVEATVSEESTPYCPLMTLWLSSVREQECAIMEGKRTLGIHVQ